MLVIDHVTYPHIVGNIIRNITSSQVITAFRLTSRHFNDRINAYYFRHIACLEFVNRRRELEPYLTSRRKPSFRLFAGFRSSEDSVMNLFPSTGMRKSFLRSMFRSVKVVDMELEILSRPDSICVFLLPVDMIRIFRCYGKLPPVRTLLTAGWTDVRITDQSKLKRIILRSHMYWYRPSDDGSPPTKYYSPPRVRWAEDADLREVVVFLDDEVWTVTNFATNLFDMIREVRKIERVLLVGDCDGADTHRLIGKLKKLASQTHLLQLFPIGRGLRGMHPIEWSTMSKAEYAMTLSEDERWLVLDDPEYDKEGNRKVVPAGMKYYVFGGG